MEVISKQVVHDVLSMWAAYTGDRWVQVGRQEEREEVGMVVVTEVKVLDPGTSTMPTWPP